MAAPKCDGCGKPTLTLWTFDAAAEVRDLKLRAQLAAEGRGAILGPLRLCNRCCIAGKSKVVAPEAAT